MACVLRLTGMITFNPQIRKLRLREVHRLSQGHPAAKRETEPSSARPEACCQAALSSSPGTWRSRLQKAPRAWMTEAGGRESSAGLAGQQGVPRVIPNPDSSLLWQAAVDTCTSALLQGPAQGAGRGKGPSPTPSAGFREAHLLQAVKLQTSRFTSLSPFSHWENVGRAFLLCKVLLVCFYLK